MCDQTWQAYLPKWKLANFELWNIANSYHQDYNIMKFMCRNKRAKLLWFADIIFRIFFIFANFTFTSLISQYYQFSNLSLLYQVIRITRNKNRAHYKFEEILIKLRWRGEKYIAIMRIICLTYKHYKHGLQLITDQVSCFVRLSACQLNGYKLMKKH